MILGTILLAALPAAHGDDLSPPPPAPPDAPAAPHSTDWRAHVGTLDAGGFPAAADARLLSVVHEHRGDEVGVDALRLLARSAERTGDWDILPFYPEYALTPPVPCDCDALALHLAVRLDRLGTPTPARRWLAAVNTASPYAPAAELLQAELDQLRPSRAGKAEARAAFTRLARLHLPAASPSADVPRRARLTLARIDCTESRFAEGKRALTRLAGPPAGDLEVDVARAWCAVDADRPGDLAALLPPLDAAAAQGAWLPSLPVLHALATGAAGDSAAEMTALNQTITGLMALDARLSATAAANVHLLRAATDGSWVLAPASNLPPALREQLAAAEPLLAVRRRLAEIDAERARTADPGVLRLLDEAEADTRTRSGALVTSLLEGYAVDLRSLTELARARVAFLRRPPGPAVSTRDVAGALRATLASPEARASLGPDTGEAEDRLLVAEAEAEPTEAALAKLQAALAAPHDGAGGRALRWALARLQIDAGRPAEATATLQAMLAADVKEPAAAPAHALLGDLEFAAGHVEAAAAQYQAATQSSKRSLALYAYYRLAWCDWIGGHPAAAKRAISLVLTDPATPTALRASARKERARLVRCRAGVVCGG